VADDHSYWEWRDALLRHPDGRANGGEPCMKCGEPVPPNAHWVNRDRHVCSPRCNHNLSRQLGRLLERGGQVPIPRPKPMASPRRTECSRIFRTVEPVGEDAIPYEFEGFSPRDGDLIERHGVVTAYGWYRAEQLEWVPEYAPHGFHMAMHESGHIFTIAATSEGETSRILHGQFTPTNARIPPFTPFEVHGVALTWIQEIIRDVLEDGREYNWEAMVCVPVAAGHPGTLWSPFYAQRSRRNKRATVSTGRHQRRLRVAAATTERFDPHEIFERDGWICCLCHAAVSPELAWPDPLSPSLDHVLPLVAGGEHSRANTQLAHWICNVRKGARTD
jgi:5-methylcytosine-specific restriction endonuclease McrA